MKIEKLWLGKMLFGFTILCCFFTSVSCFIHRGAPDPT